jgi:hypothetical protein
MSLLKKIVFTSLIGISISCSTDDNNNSSNDDNNEAIPLSIIGDWEVVSFVSNEIELVEPDDCLSKYTITENTTRFLEYYPFNNECTADEDDIISYPILAYEYDGEVFIFDGLTYEIIELTENTIKWSATYLEDGETITDIEILQRE